MVVNIFQLQRKAYPNWLGYEIRWEILILSISDTWKIKFYTYQHNWSFKKKNQILKFLIISLLILTNWKKLKNSGLLTLN